MIVLGFNDTSTLVGHFVSSPREREKSDRRDEQNETEEIKEIKNKIKTSPHYPYLLQGQQALPNWKPVSVERPGDVRFLTPLPHPTTPQFWEKIFQFSIKTYIVGTH